MLLAPARWGPPVFDEVRQELIRIVWDRHGCPLPLVLRHQKETEEAVTALSEHDPSATRSVLGILRLGADLLCVEPIALHTDEKLRQPHARSGGYAASLADGCRRGRSDAARRKTMPKGMRVEPSG